MNTDCVTVTTLVHVDPRTAFEVFTRDIGRWWRPKVRGLFRKGANGTLEFDEGRLVERYGDDDFVEIGRVLEWDPPHLLVFEWRQEGFADDERTQVEVRFTPEGDATRVMLEHRGWDALAASHPGRRGYTGGAFMTMIGLRWGDPLTSFRLACGGNSNVRENLRPEPVLPETPSGPSSAG